MIPVLVCPVLRPDLVGRMLASVDVPVGRSIVIDNGAGLDVPGAIHLPANLGVAASWNLGLKLTPDAPWWFITNDDITYAPGDLARLAAAMGDEPLVATLDGMAAFGLNAAALEAVGWFDENYHPAYCEDADYEYRCRLAGVRMLAVPAGLHHERSSTIGLPQYARQNARTYPANVAYFTEKWGGPLRGGERFGTPFDEGGDVRDYTAPSFARLRDLHWE